jgi:hypothetical protein
MEANIRELLHSAPGEASWCWNECTLKTTHLKRKSAARSAALFHWNFFVVSGKPKAFKNNKSG